MAKSKPETELSAKAAKQLEALGFVVVRLHAGVVRVAGGFMHGNRKGCPDRAVLLSGGRILWLEAKYGKGEPSADQVAWRERVERKGHQVVTFWTPLDAVRAAVAAEKQQQGREA